jgi:hypothetical protein
MRTPCRTGLAAALLVAVSSLLHANHPLPGPHFLRCENGGPREVVLSWDDLGIGDGSLHEAVILRDDVHIVTLDPQAVQHVDRDVPAGFHSYRLEIRVREPADQDPIATETCELVAGGLVCEVFGGIAVPPVACVSWPGVPLGTSEIVILRDGEAVATLPGDTLQYKEEPLQGEHEYEAVALLPEGGRESLGKCTANYNPPVIGGFQRGDCNGDGAQDLSDGVCILLFLFAGGQALCADAADADDTGVIEITDAIFLLSHLFLGGGPPPAPYPGCGHDGTDDSLGCDVHAPCFTPPPP